MSRKPLDLELNKLAHELAGITFLPASTIRVTVRGKNFYIQPGGELFLVRLSLGGKVWTLGFTPREDDAARFADMALEYFRAFRNGGAMPAREQYNYTPAQTAADFQNETAATNLLEKLRHRLTGMRWVAETKEQSDLGPEILAELREIKRILVSPPAPPVITPAPAPVLLPDPEAPPGSAVPVMSAGNRVMPVGNPSLNKLFGGKKYG